MSNQNGSGLFRQEATAYQADRLYGGVVLGYPPQYRYYSYAIVVIIVLALGLLLSKSFVRKETVIGILTPSLGIVRITSHQAGIVDAILVSSGQMVHEGDPLLIVRDSSSLKSGESLAEKFRHELDERIALLNEQLSSVSDSYQKLTLQQDEKIESLQREFALLAEQMAVSKKRNNIAAGELAKITALYQQGSVSEKELNAYRERDLASQSELREIARQNLSAEQALKSSRFNRKQLAAEELEKRADINLKISELQEKLAAVDLQVATTIKATTAGRVSNLNIKKGQLVQSNQVIATIIPAETELEAELYVASRSAGFIENGQPLNIRFAAFPFQKFGIQKATIESVENNLTLPGDNADLPYPLKEPAYKVTAKLQSQTITVYGKERPLKAGLLLEADIQLSTRNVFEWMFEPLFTLRGRL